MAKGFEISEVRLPANGGYLVVARLKGENIEATFEVTLTPRRQRRGWHKELRHHMKTFEILEREARGKVAAFCRKLAGTLEEESPRH